MIALAFVLGAIVGVAGAYAWYDGWRLHMKRLAEKETAEWTKQVAELRAQVARYIGTQSSSSTSV